MATIRAKVSISGDMESEVLLQKLFEALKSFDETCIDETIIFPYSLVKPDTTCMHTLCKSKVIASDSYGLKFCSEGCFNEYYEDND